MTNDINTINDAEKTALINITERKYLMNVKDMIELVGNEPKRKMIYSGIKEKSFGLVFGVSKGGKSTYVENLAFSVASGQESYLGLPIDISNRKVIIMGLEEHYTPRTERNMKQLMALNPELDAEWLQNIMVITEDMPRYFDHYKEWDMLKKLLLTEKPGLVIIDSLTHMYSGSIEDSEVAKQLMKRFRELSEETNTTIVSVHHTHKLYDKGLSIHTIAGSRIIAQETDFMIGINRTSNGCHYIKDVAFRYIATDSERVLTFKIDENYWLQPTGYSTEEKILSQLDGRHDDGNSELIYQSFELKLEECGEGKLTTKELTTEFIDSGLISKQTLFTNLNKLVKDGKIKKIEKGVYGIAA